MTDEEKFNKEAMLKCFDIAANFCGRSNCCNKYQYSATDVVAFAVNMGEFLEIIHKTNEKISPSKSK